MSHKPYVLYGRKLDRRVYHAPARERSRAEWVQHLREQGITLLAVGPIRRDFSDRKELVWLRDESGAFVRVFGPDQVLGMVLFRLRE
jgi:hypothetical protein